MKRSELLIAIVLMVPVAWLVEGLRSWWFVDVLSQQSFGASPTWLSLGHLTRWAFEFVWSFVLGVSIASVLRAKRVVYLAAICGAVEGLLHFWFSSIFFSSSVDWTMYLWAYGTYFVPSLGAAIGAMLMVGLVPTRKQSAV